MSKIDIAQMKQIAFDCLEDDKAVDIQILDIPPDNAIADCLIFASGNSSRHVNALSEHLVEKFKTHNIRPVSVDGLEKCDWVLLDFTDIIIHLFKPEIRQFYDLEKLWQPQKP